jgi:carbamoyl-phosphate synthase/aspartate carbamoyltransferase
VLSGAAMNVVYSAGDLANYLSQATAVSREHPVVITKFIEEAKEIEMDAVAKDGKMIMHVISEHVENAGVHSGDATLILPPQDLDPETVRKIHLATEKIGNALNVTGPFNIQFMAKDNEIKVIECNVRASRSFPFVSKVLGVDLIEMATKAMLNIPFEAYPRVELPKHYVGIKVPQFSFGRLSGADPVLGVEMASTGEVACFGKTKYDAYLKALLSSGFTLPKRNILLSIGAYKEKVEMLPSVERLHQHGYQLFATAGTADFLQEHGVPVRTLEALDSAADTADQRQEYSLQQHLANNLIDLYINLPSKNRYRRPANYMSRGYRTRRMAVDFSVPLITNVKCAKLFVEALSRNIQLDISSVDYKSGHRTLTLPGLINIQAYIEGQISRKEDYHLISESVKQVTRASLAGGFTAVCAMPAPSGICDVHSLQSIHQHWRGNAHCDYSLAVIAANDNGMSAIHEVKGDAAALLLSFDKRQPAHITRLDQVDGYLREWPSWSAVITDASGADLSGTMLLANLYGRPLHVTGIYRQEDIEMIALSKQRGMPVTCDVNVYNLFISVADITSASSSKERLGTSSDVAALWKHLDIIDCFSVGRLPDEYTCIAGDSATANKVKDDVPRDGSATSSLSALPLLLSAVKEGRLTMEDIVTRLYHNPKRIFGFPDQPDCFIELEVDRVGTPSTLAQHPLQGYIHRVVMHGHTVFLDGRYFIDGNYGRDVTAKVRGNLHQVATKPKETTLTREIITTDVMDTTTANRPHKLAVVVPMVATTTTANAATTATGTAISASNVVPTDTATDGTTTINAPVAASAAAQTGLTTGQDMLASHDMSGGLSPHPMKQPSLITNNINNRFGSISYTLAHSPFYRKHITTIKQFTREELHHLFGLAQEMGTLVEKGTPLDLLRGRVLCNLFYEPSTRTSCSFEAAMLRLGGTVTSVDAQTSSIKKGETLSDTGKLFTITNFS